MAVVDLRNTPPSAIAPLQVNSLGQHPVTVIEDFLIVDSRASVSPR